MNPTEKLQKIFQKSPLENDPCHTRVHPLSSYSSSNRAVFVKREDEMGPLACGNKWRKYLSLLPYLRDHKFTQAILLGSAYSNHLLACTQLLIQNQITPLLFIQASPPIKVTGNYLLTSLLVPSSSIHWIAEKDSIETYIENYKRSQPHEKMAVIPEGGSCKEALLGAITLALDIIENEKERNVAFSHVFIDSGTAFSALSLAYTFHYLQKDCIIHIVQIAGKEEEMQKRALLYQKYFEELVEEPLKEPFSYRWHYPTKEASFGSWHPSLFQEIQETARNEGIFTDPIYSAKLFRESRRIMLEQNLTGNILLIHTGGVFTLAGFQEMLAKVDK